MKPIWKVTADGIDITGACAKRLLSLEITDEAGIASDTIAIELDNRDLAIAAPRKGAKLECWIGYEEAGLVHMGQFVVDELEAAGPAHGLTIKGKAADMRKEMKEQKTRGWDGITIGDLVKTIAAEHTLIPVVAPALAGIAVPNLAQTNESDMALLTRVAKTYDAVSKPMAGRLLFVPRGEAKSASGKALPSVSLGAADFRTYRATQADRGKYGAVVAQWHNPATGQPESIKVGILAQRLAELHERMAGVVIECLDFEPFIRRYDTKGTLFFCDSPYVGTEDYYDASLFQEESLWRLAATLKSIKGRFIATNLDHPKVRDAFRDCEIREVGVTYTAGGRGTSKQVGELIIIGPSARP